MAAETEDLTLLKFSCQTRCSVRTCISLHAAVSVRRTVVSTLEVITSLNSSVLGRILNFERRPIEQLIPETKWRTGV